VHIWAPLETFRGRERAWLLRIPLLREERLIFFHVLQRRGRILMQLTRIKASEHRSTLSTCGSTVRATMRDTWGAATLLVKASSVLECRRDGRVQIGGIGAHFISGQNRFVVFERLLHIKRVLIRCRGWSKSVGMVKRVDRVIDVNHLAVRAVSMRATPAMAQWGGRNFGLNLGRWETHLSKWRFRRWL
jgi:hypothetical protein